MTGTRAEHPCAHSARLERGNGVATMQGMGFYVAKRVKRVVLRVLITVAQLVGHLEHCGDLWLKQKSDAANLEQKLGSHGRGLGGASLSLGLWVVRTTILEILGSNQAMYMVPPL